MLDEKDKNEIQQMITRRIILGFNKKVGDTPTEALQLTNRKYVSSVAANAQTSVFSSIQAGFTINGNLVIGGSASVQGNSLTAPAFQTGGAASEYAASASIAGNLKVGGTASIAGAANFHLTMTVANTITAQGVAIPRTYYGNVLANGVATTPFPTDWTSSVIATGNYLVTHNLGTAVYTISVTPSSFLGAFQARQANSFEVMTRDAAGTAIHDAFSFVVNKA